MAGGGLDAGEVYVVVGAHIDTGAFAKADAAMRSTVRASDNYSASIKRGEAASKKLGESMDRAKSSAILAAKATAIGFGGAAAALAGTVVAAAGFDSAMRNVNSIAGLSEKGLKGLEAQLLALAPAVGKTPTDLANGLYDIVSSGFKASDAIKILKTSAIAATAGMTDTATASGAIVGALNAFHIPAKDADKVASDLFETVKKGVVSFPQLAQQMGDLTGLAPTLGVSLQEVTGAFALLTTLGGPAAERSTQVKAVMSSLLKPSKDLSKAMKDVGVANGEAGVKAFGFAGFLEKLKAATHGNNEAITKMFPNVRALAGFLGLTGTNAKKAAEFIDANTKAYKDGNEQTKAFAEQSKSTSVQFDKLKSSVSTAAIIIGTALLPQVNAGIGALSKWLSTAQKSGDLTKWAHDVSGAVTDVVSYIHSLGPQASAVFHALVGIVRSVVPAILDIYHALQKVAPEVEAVARGVASLAQSLGTGPILGMVAAFWAMHKASQAASVGVGKYAAIMKAGMAGSEATSLASGAGGFAKTAVQAEKAASKVATFGRGLAKSFGPQLIAVGVAAIVGGIILIRNNMEDLEQGANRATSALQHLNDTRLDLSSARLDVTQAKLDVRRTAGGLGGAAVRVANARDALQAAQAYRADGHPGAKIDPALVARLVAAEDDQTQAILNHKRALDRLAEAQKKTTDADAAKKKATEDLTKRMGGLTTQATNAAKAAVAPLRAAEIQQGRTNVSTATAQAGADAYAKALHKSAAETDGLTASTRSTANHVADLVQSMGHVPTKAQSKIIVDDIAAGKSIQKIRADLGWVAKTKPKPKVDADTTPVLSKLGVISSKLDALLEPKSIPVDVKDDTITPLDAMLTKIHELTASAWHVNVVYAATGTTTPPGGKTPPLSFGAKGHWVNGKWVAYAAGHKTKQGQPEIAVIGEGDAPEYVIPTERRHRAGGIQLWLQAAKDLGIPGFKGGVKKPGKTPPPIQHGLGYDPAALDQQKSNEEQRLAQARTYRDQLAAKTKTDSDHKKSLEKEKATAETAAKSKNAKTAAAAKKRVTNLAGQIASLESKIATDRAAHKRQVDVVIPADTKRYQAATAAARIGDDHAAKITLWQDRADADTNAMDLAANKWNQADRKKDQRGRDAAYREWDTARKARGADLGHVRDLLKEVLKVAGMTDYGAKIKGQLTGVLNDISTAADDANAPNYEAPQDPQAASTQLSDYLNQWETDVQSAYDQDSARASTTDDLGDDVLAAQNQLLLAKEIEGRLEAVGAPVDIVTQALQGVKSAQDALTSAVQATTAPQQTQDVTDQLAQQKTLADNAAKTAASSEAALRTFAESGDLFRGQGITVNVGVRALTADSTDVQRSVGSEVVKALGSQPYVPTSTGYYRG